MFVYRSKGVAGGVTVVEPMRPYGPACDVNTGSLTITVDAVQIRNVEWPIQVTATDPCATVSGGAGWSWSGTRAGQAVRSRVRIHVMTSFSGRALPCGLKNRSPSQ